MAPKKEISISTERQPQCHYWQNKVKLKAVSDFQVLLCKCIWRSSCKVANGEILDMVMRTRSCNNEVHNTRRRFNCYDSNRVVSFPAVFFLYCLTCSGFLKGGRSGRQNLWKEERLEMITVWALDKPGDKEMDVSRRRADKSTYRCSGTNTLESKNHSWFIEFIMFFFLAPSNILLFHLPYL